MMRRVFIAAILFVAVWAPSLLVAAEAGRADLMGKLCGDAASLGDAGRAFVGIAADGSQDERAWATPVARAVIDRKLTCDTKGAVVISSEGSFDALTREQRVAVEGAGRRFSTSGTAALFETAVAALALRTAPDPAQRGAALRTLERQAAGLPEHLFEAAAEQESDAGLRRK